MIVVSDDEHWDELQRVRLRTSPLCSVLTVLVAEGPAPWEMEDDSVSHLR
jgi:hypothetical protein